MLAKNLFFAFALSAIGLAQDIDDNDVPQQCRDVCSPVVSLTRTCDQQNDDNDSGYINCVCSSQNANTQIPLCEACVAANDNDGRDNDVNDLIRSCSFTTTSYNPSAASASQTASGSQSMTSNASQPTGSALTSVLSSLTGSAASSLAGATQSTGSVAGQSTNAAPMPTAGMVGVGMGALGVAWGMI